MQLKITLSGNKIQLPLAYSSTIQGFIYNALVDDLDFADNLHENGYTFKSRKFKLFSFAEPTGKYEVIEKQLIFKDRVFLEIRSVDDYMIQLMLSHFSNRKSKCFGKNKVNIESVGLKNKIIYSDNIRVRTNSPITVYQTESDGHTTYFSPEDKNFYESIYNNAKRKWSSYSGTTSGFDFSIAPTENSSFVKRATRFKDTFITAWHGEFYLKGNIELLNFLYNTGLGSKNSQGFGLFDMVE